VPNKLAWSCVYVKTAGGKIDRECGELKWHCSKHDVN